MAAGTARATNEELIERLQAVEQGTEDATAIMGELWEKNKGLVNLAIRKATGLLPGDKGFEDLQQQAYFGFHSAAYKYDPAARYRFSSFVIKQIQWELSRYYENHGYSFRIPCYITRRLREFSQKRNELTAEMGHAVRPETVLKAMGLTPSVIAETLSLMNRLNCISIDSKADNSDDDSRSLLEKMSDGTDLETLALGQEWHRELHELLFKALQEIPEETRAAIIRRYFVGLPYTKIAEETGQTPKMLYDREKASFLAIRTGKYGRELTDYMPSMNEKMRALRTIYQTKEAVKRLDLSDAERGLLSL